MPSIAQVQQTNSTRVDALPSAQDREKPELAALWLPSNMPSHLRESGCVDGLLEKEKQLRLADANDALAGLRRQLQIMMGVFNYKKAHVSGSGQRANTHARTLMTQISDKIHLFADRYRAARLALTKLDPDGEWQNVYLPLHTQDIRGPGRNWDDTPEGRRAARLSGIDGPDTSEGRREVSWLWLTASTRSQASSEAGNEFEVAEGKLHHACVPMSSLETFVSGMRVEWAKSHARAQRWSEEMVLVIEEMHRVIQYLDWKASWWRSQGTVRSSTARPDILSGLTAYAERQADLMVNLAKSFASLWHPILAASQLPIDWPTQYTEHGQANPTFRRAARHVKKRKPAVGGQGSGEDDSSGDGSDEDSDTISDDNDDVDASPYQ